MEAVVNVSWARTSLIDEFVMVKKKLRYSNHVPIIELMLMLRLVVSLGSKKRKSLKDISLRKELEK